MKYIDADRLCAEIEKIYKSEIQPWLSGVSATSAIYDYVLPLIDSLQQEQQEVDLEKELEDYARENPTEDAGSYRNLMNIACHFYELGLNARKEENK